MNIVDKKTTCSNSCFDCLCCQVPTDDLAEFENICDMAGKLGYYGVLANVFVSIDALGCDFDNSRLIYTDDDAVILFMDDEKRKRIKQVLNHYGLKMPSCHFLQTLQPMGEKPQWIFDTHLRLLDMAAFFNVECVTTHFGWMFGEQSIDFMGDNVRKLNQFEISRDDYLIELVKRAGGRQKVLDDSFLIYEHLCKAAAQRGISVTIETVPSPFNTACSEGILELISFIGADNLGICIDSGHCNAVGISSGDAIRAAGGKMLETHFHDNFGRQSTWSLSDMHNPLGVGTINWVDVISAMKTVDYKGKITFEQNDFELNSKMWHLFLNISQKLGYNYEKI